ncbi:MAG TPA: ribonuclease H-like domain-containing protein [Terriglobia bacterium]|nr:ribonuclease H-like domain-containing protein [Terriglobia bacterium]
MNLEEKLRALKKAAAKPPRDEELERQLEYLRRMEEAPKKLPAQRAAHGIEHYVDGSVDSNLLGEFFSARQSFSFGRPYGKLRVGDISTAELKPLEIFLAGSVLPPAARLIYLDTETTGLAGGTGTCAFLIGVGMIEGRQFAVRQYFLRDYPEEKAVLAALAETLDAFDGVVTFNGKTFDLPLLETRYALARMKSPFARLVHLDLLHPARRLWKMRLDSCALTHLEKEVLGIGREGDVDGSEIPGIYFDYLRTGDARGLQPVFYHNALDIITLAALTVELANVIAEGVETLDSGTDLFSLSGIFERAGVAEKSLAACRRALDAGLPQDIETRALWRMALYHKRQGEFEEAIQLWQEMTRREAPFCIQALEELAIHFEHRRRDLAAALSATETALERLRELSLSKARLDQFAYRRERLKKKSARAAVPAARTAY